MRKIDYNKKQYENSEALIQIHSDQSFNFNKVILRNNLFRAKEKHNKKLTFMTHFINFENECVPNENYFKSKKRVTVLRYKPRGFTE